MLTVYSAYSQVISVKKRGRNIKITALDLFYL